MNQQQVKYLRTRLQQIAISKINAIKEEDAVLLKANNDRSMVTRQDIIDCLKLDVDKFTDLNSEYGINLTTIREFLDKPERINDYVNSNGPKRVTYDSVTYDFPYSIENAKRAKNIIAHLNVTIDEIVLGTAEDAAKALESFSSKVF